MNRLFLVLPAVSCLLTAPGVADGQERLPWTTSRVHGSPEPPLPYVVEPALHAHRFREPTELDFVPGSDWALILELRGKLYALDRRHPQGCAEIADFAEWMGGPAEAFSIAFHPQWPAKPFVYLASFDLKQNLSKIVRFEMEIEPKPTLSLASGTLIMAWESGGHKGGDLQFGPDGFLYIAVGDAEVPAPPDPRRTGQDLSDWLSSILRIDIDQEEGGKAYRIPPDNPFVERPGVRPEIWAYGFRNPWKMSFDPRDGALWIGDVGWELWELLFRVDHGGFNGGWSLVEGPQPVNTSWPQGPTPIEKPVISHSHSEATSITGGLVYRAARLPELQDAYIYGDWGTGKIWALWWENGVIRHHFEIAQTPHRIIGFALDDKGDLFYMDYGDGQVYRLIPNPNRETPSDFPRRLSETGLFASTETGELAPGVYPFDITASMWSDHATAQRAVAFPDMTKAVARGDFFESPVGAVLTKTLSLEMERGNPESAAPVETQLLHFTGQTWNGYSYRWNAEATDADLVGAEGDMAVFDIADAEAPGGRRMQRWRFHSRSECIRCHLVSFQQLHGNLNAFTPSQLASRRTGREGAGELDRLRDLGLIEAPGENPGRPRLVDPQDATASLDDRARSYLHVNCAHCHRNAGTGAVTMYWPIDHRREQTNAFDVPPRRGDFGIRDARIIAPGDPDRSTVLYRHLTTGTGRMPAIGSLEVDASGALLLRDWIASLTDHGEGPQATSWEDTAFAVHRALEVIGMDTDERSPFVAEAMASANRSAHDLFQRFLPPDQRRPVLGVTFDPMAVLALRGDPERGRDLFFGPSGPQCATCHRVDGRGRDYGPDLSSIAEKYERDMLLNHIVNPGASLDPEWQAHVVTTADGESHVGFIALDTDDELHLRTATEEVVILLKERIRSDEIVPTSLMPEASLAGLTPQEAADLLAFLSPRGGRE